MTRMRAKAALVSGLVAVAATTGLLFAATSASAVKCPPPLTGSAVCNLPVIVPGCDPAPCPPTSVPQS